MKAKLILLVAVLTAGVCNLGESAELVPGMGYSKLKVPVAPPSYIVRQGDTLGGIAKRFGVTVVDLIRANKIKDAKSLRIGQKLIIARSAHAAASS